MKQLLSSLSAYLKSFTLASKPRRREGDTDPQRGDRATVLLRCTAGTLEDFSLFKTMPAFEI